MNKLYKWMIVATTATPLVALAQAQAAPIRSIEDVVRVMNTFIGWFQAILFVIAVIFILYAAFLYITSGGNSEKLETAKNILIYAAVGIGVALLAYAIEPVVRQLLGAGPGL
ncbi:MAG: hypothetical protein ABH822_02445 [Patescibacteria group bacterium]